MNDTDKCPYCWCELDEQGRCSDFCTRDPIDFDDDSDNLEDKEEPEWLRN